MERIANSRAILWEVVAGIMVFLLLGCAPVSTGSSPTTVETPSLPAETTAPTPTPTADQVVTFTFAGEGTAGDTRINLNPMADGSFSVGDITLEVTCIKAQGGRSGTTDERDGIVARIGGVITASDSDDPTMQVDMVRWIDVADFGAPTAENPTPDRFAPGRAPQDMIEEDRVRGGNCAAPPANNIYEAEWQTVEGDFVIQGSETP